MVYGQRRQRDGESLFKRATSAAFYRLIGRMTESRSRSMPATSA